MATNAETAYEAMKAREGNDLATGDWFTVDQDLINRFADVTLDHQFIHVDPAKAAELSPWKVTIAHGFLTLSMLVHLSGSIKSDGPRLDGLVMGVNYGFDKIRFLNPVKVDSKIRASGVTKSVVLKDPNTILSTRTMTVEAEGETRPALIADWITMLAFS